MVSGYTLSVHFEPLGSWPAVSQIEDKFLSHLFATEISGLSTGDLWKFVSSSAKSFQDDVLACRVLTHLALALRKPRFSRFVAEFLSTSGFDREASLFADYGLAAADKAWQKRKLREIRDVERGAVPEPQFDVDVAAFAIEISGDEVYVSSDADESEEQWRTAPSWLDALGLQLRQQPLHTPCFVLVRVRPGTPNAQVRSILSRLWLLGCQTALIVMQEETASRQQVLDEDLSFMTMERAAWLPIFGEEEGNAAGFSLAYYLGKPLQRTLSTTDLRLVGLGKVIEFLAFGWAIKFIASPAVSIPNPSDLSNWLAPVCGCFAHHGNESAARLAVAFEGGSARDYLAFQRMAAVLQSWGRFEASIPMLQVIPSSSRDSYWTRRMNRAFFSTARFSDVIAPYGAQKDGRFDRKLRAEARAAELLIERLRSSPTPGAASLPADRKLKVATILHASAPYQSGGYANRAHQLVAQLANHRIDLECLTRPGFPEEGHVGLNEIRSEPFEDVMYSRCDVAASRSAGEYQYMLEGIDVYRAFLLETQPDIVHLRSTYVTALPGLIAARELGIPAVYEVSGMWELVYEGLPARRGESKRARTVCLENEVLRLADRVTTLTRAMADIVLSRVGSRNEIDVVPNAVDPEKFKPAVRDTSVIEELDWPTHAPIIGYAGSVVGYEGLDVLVDALAYLKERGVEYRFLLIGDGKVMPQVIKRIESKNIADWVHATGRIPHSDVERYYTVFDICAFPRHLIPATAAVSPLKPFEALAAAKAVIVSDVPALAEIIGENERGLVVKHGDSEALADALETLIRNPTLRERLGRGSREWILENHTWERVGAKFTGVLRSVLGSS